MENKTNITVIIPINGLLEVDVPYFTKAIDSIKNMDSKPDEVIITTCDCPDLNKFIDEYDFSGLTVTKIINPDANSFTKQINFAASKVKTKYFSILEFDDEYAKNWFTHVLNYEKHYPEIKVWLPIVVDINPEKNFLGLTNEAVWAMNFGDELGILDNQSLNGYPNFQTSGAVIDTDAFITLGGFKTKFKLTFVYELLLRLTYQSVKVMTIPKVGYIHTNLRENSLFWSYKNTKDTEITGKEAEFWVQKARDESFFPHDRDIDIPEF
jgi:GT2 family glycosyltransferase